jgi:hypothetical protein
MSIADLRMTARNDDALVLRANEVRAIEHDALTVVGAVARSGRDFC